MFGAGDNERRARAIVLIAAALVGLTIGALAWRYASDMSGGPPAARSRGRRAPEKPAPSGPAGGVRRSPSQEADVPAPADIPRGDANADRRASDLDGARSVSSVYKTALAPVDIQLQYTDRFVKEWAIVRDKVLDPDGYGWIGVFVNLSTDRVVTVVAKSDKMGPAPGGSANPTTVSIVEMWRPDD